MINNFKIGDKVYCFITLKSYRDDEIMISTGVYTISDIFTFSNGESYRLKEFENTNKVNIYHNSYFISLAELRRIKLNNINKNV